MRARYFMLSAEQYIEMLDTRRRLLSLCYLGEVTEAKARGRVKVRLQGTNVDVGPLPVMVPAGGGGYRQSNPLPVGAKVWVFLPQGDPGLGFVLGAIAAEDEAPADENFVVEFEDGMGLVITKDAAELRYGGSPIMSISKDGITIEKKIIAKDGLEVTGDVKASGDVAAKGEVSAGQVKLSEHIHPYTDDGAPVKTQAPLKTGG